MEALIYALCKPDGIRCYVGSTLGTLHRRLIRHRSRAATGERPHSRLHNLMRDLDPSLFTIELIESVPVAARLATEAHHIRAFGTLNHQVPGRTQNQRRAEARAARALLAALATPTELARAPAPPGPPEVPPHA